jgi:hypothetical protein
VDQKIDSPFFVASRGMQPVTPEHKALLILDNFIEIDNNSLNCVNLFADVKTSRPELHAQMLRVIDPEMEEDSKYLTMGLRDLKQFASKMRVDIVKRNKRQIVDAVAIARDRNELTGLTKFVHDSITASDVDAIRFKRRVCRMDSFILMRESLMGLCPSPPNKPQHPFA